MIFIRPLTLLLLLIPLLFHISSGYSSHTTPWAKWVDKKLLPYLLTKNNNSKKKHRYQFLTILWFLLVFAAAGPAFQKLPVPTTQDLPNTVIIFDLGPTMRGATLTTAKVKMHDLLTALKGNRVGLVLYADKGYTALPLTEDRAIVRSLVSSLDPSVLPNTLQSPASGFQKANELIQQAGGKGRIIYLTAGGVNARNIETTYPVGILGLNDSAISTSLKQLGTYQAKTTDASDILTLLKATEPDTTIQLDNLEQADTWADLGGIITLCLLPFLALTFRRGFLFLLTLGYFIPAQASFFKRPDQEAYQQHIQAVSYYRNGQYEEAIQGFKNDAYNRGNALAYAGKIQEAIASYEEALKEDAKNEDALFNKEYLEKQLPPPQQNQQQNNSDQNEQQNQNDENQEQQQNQNNEDQQSADEKQEQEQEQEPQQDQNDENQEQQQNQDNQQQEQSENQDESEQTQPYQPQEQDSQQQPQDIDESNKEQLPFNQEEQKLLNRLNRDPYRVLRYRIQQQARQK